MSFIKICYYPAGNSGPVKDYLDALAAVRPAAYVKLVLDLEILGAEGLRSKQITIRPLGQGLWELKRLFEGVQYRIFFCVERGCAWLLHAIEKKSAKTPIDDMRLARKRMRGI
ncbi:MAG TPA: type II toxin-antitoxin system RelE/ParE family toxin [Elusimicrobia bacterium]|nr:type II toxin-antitoxin system RelE/ParE family toxin [Elusimicrobiota bacterium]